MSIKVKGLFEDIGGAGRVTELRRKNLQMQAAGPIPGTRSASLPTGCILRK